MKTTEATCGLCGINIKIKWIWSNSVGMSVVENTVPDSTYVEHGCGWCCMKCRPYHPLVV